MFGVFGEGQDVSGLESLLPDALGVAASVVFDSEGGPRTVTEEVAQDYRDVGPGYLDDIRIVSIWTFHVALYALQNPTEENIDRALELIGTSGDCEEWWDEDTHRPLPVSVPPGFGYEGWPGVYETPEDE